MIRWQRHRWWVLGWLAWVGSGAGADEGGAGRWQVSLFAGENSGVAVARYVARRTYVEAAGFVGGVWHPYWAGHLPKGYIHFTYDRPWGASLGLGWDRPLGSADGRWVIGGRLAGEVRVFPNLWGIQPFIVEDRVIIPLRPLPIADRWWNVGLSGYALVGWRPFRWVCVWASGGVWMHPVPWDAPPLWPTYRLGVSFRM